MHFEDQPVELSKMLCGLGGAAEYSVKIYHAKRTPEEKDDALKTIKEFKRFLKMVPEYIEKRPNLVNRDFYLDLVDAGISYGHLDCSFMREKGDDSERNIMFLLA